MPPLRRILKWLALVAGAILALLVLLAVGFVFYTFGLATYRVLLRHAQEQSQVRDPAADWLQAADPWEAEEFGPGSRPG